MSSAIYDPTTRLLSDETYALRNPDNPIQPLRERTQNRPTDAEKIVIARRRNNRKQTKDQIEMQIENLRKENALQISNIAKQFNYKEKKIHDAVYYASSYKHTRDVTPWNAELSYRSERINAEREAEGLPRKDAVKVTAQVIAEKAEGKGALTEEELKFAIRRLEEKRKLQATGSCPTNRSAARDVHNTTTRITNEAKYLTKRSGALVVFAVSRGHIKDTFPPTVFESKNAQGFLEKSLGYDCDNVASRLECWASMGGSGPHMAKSTKGLRKECAAMISAGLCELTKIENLAMNYRNYDTSIVARYHVQLKGWPQNVPFINPSDFPKVDQLRQLRDALAARTCYWEQMTAAEIQVHNNGLNTTITMGGTVGVPRKERSDKNKKRKLAGKDSGGKKKKKRVDAYRKAAQQMPVGVFQSSEMVSSDTDTDNDEEPEASNIPASATSDTTIQLPTTPMVPTLPTPSLPTPASPIIHSPIPRHAAGTPTLNMSSLLCFDVPPQLDNDVINFNTDAINYTYSNDVSNMFNDFGTNTFFDNQLSTNVLFDSFPDAYIFNSAAFDYPSVPSGPESMQDNHMSSSTHDITSPSYGFLPTSPYSGIVLPSSHSTPVLAPAEAFDSMNSIRRSSRLGGRHVNVHF